MQPELKYTLLGFVLATIAGIALIIYVTTMYERPTHPYYDYVQNACLVPKPAPGQNVPACMEK